VKGGRQVHPGEEKDLVSARFSINKGIFVMYTKTPSRVMLTLALFALVSLALVPIVSADKVYHSQHVELMPTGNAPLRSGFVENIHVNGPNIFAIERYMLNGATPNATYHVQLFIYSDTACTTLVGILPTATFSTNPAGNGTARAVITPDDVPSALRNQTVGVRWEITSASGEVYSTECTAVALD